MLYETFTTRLPLLASILAVHTGLSSGAAVGSRALERRDVLKPLKANADDIEKKFQPWMDFDKDGCYNTAAIDACGKMNPGLPPDQHNSATYPCRDKNRLDNNNVYSRKKCDGGKCAIMYEYYFEKDHGAGGHRHDWENVIVFTNGDKIEKVATSCHGEYHVMWSTSASWRTDATGYHPKVVYHKDGVFTHCIRMANKGDEAIENHYGQWFVGPLVGWEGYPSTAIRTALMTKWEGGVRPKIADGEFEKYIRRANNPPVTPPRPDPNGPPM